MRRLRRSQTNDSCMSETSPTPDVSHMAVLFREPLTSKVTVVFIVVKRVIHVRTFLSVGRFEPILHDIPVKDTLSSGVFAKIREHVVPVTDPSLSGFLNWSWMPRLRCYQMKRTCQWYPSRWKFRTDRRLRRCQISPALRPCRPNHTRASSQFHPRPYRPEPEVHSISSSSSMILSDHFGNSSSLSADIQSPKVSCQWGRPRSVSLPSLVSRCVLDLSFIISCGYDG